MRSSKPYLIRALYEWLLDNEVTPYILIDTSHRGVVIPKALATDRRLVLNLAPSAIDKLDMTNDHLSFSARFGGVAQDVYCPMDSILAIYARENGEGMMFDTESEKTSEMDDPATGVDKSKKSTHPALKVVK
ncbi:MAG: ClpXP protease specificity-enhancing factor [Gammaproteobacteria bacterium]